MKKLSAILLLVMMLTVFVGCKSKTNNEPFKIENFNWVMESVQDIKDEGNVVACGIAFVGSYGDLSVIDLRCKADKGELIINDKTNSKSYNGTYTVMETSSKSVIYKIYVEEKEGMAIVSNTDMSDGSSVKTLIMSFEDYSVKYFETAD